MSTIAGGRVGGGRDTSTIFTTLPREAGQHEGVNMASLFSLPTPNLK